MNKSLLALATAAALAFAGTAQAADFNLINLDGPGVGLNNTTPAAPVGGNPGKTRGEQALNVYRFAMGMWGGILESNVPINVYASFAPQACTATSGTLASAGANWLFLLTSDKTRFYGSALADSLIGFDLHAYFGLPANDPGDIVSRFNGNLGTPGCLETSSWYFGLDGKTPVGATNFLNVVMHELAHGLGVQGFLNTTSGALRTSGGVAYSDAYTFRAYDNVLNLPFESMTNAQRQLALRTPGRTVWNGPRVNADAALILDNRLTLRPSAPGAIAGKDYEIGFAQFGPLASPANFGDNALVLIDDGHVGAGTVTDGCSTLGAATGPNDTIVYANAAAVAGKVAVIDRGTCSFEYKAKIAQDNGAVGVVIVNNAAGVIDMAMGSPPTTGLVIPTVMVSQADGTEIKANLTGARAGVILGALLAGADAAGRTRLYTPATVASGSTYSHFDTSLTPNALMEPFNTASLQAQVNTDLTPAMFADIGWRLKSGNANFASCDTGIDSVGDGGVSLGANVEATNAHCLATSATRASYSTCMLAHRDKLLADGLINSTQGMKLAACIKKQHDQIRR